MPKPTKDSRPSPAEVEKNFRAELEGKLAEMRKPKNPTFAGLPPEYGDLLQPGLNISAAAADAEMRSPTRSMPIRAVEEAAPQVKAAMKILAEWNRPKGGATSKDEVVAPASQFKPANVKVYGDPTIPYAVHGVYDPKRPFDINLQGKTALDLFTKNQDKAAFYEAMKTLGHESTHFYQHRFQDNPNNNPRWSDNTFDTARAFALPQDELNKKVLSREFSMSGMKQGKDGDFHVTESDEYVANVFGALMKNLIKAQDENDYQTSIGLRPH